MKLNLLHFRNFAFCEKSHFTKIRMRKIAFCEKSHFAKTRIFRKFACEKSHFTKTRILRKIAFCENSHFAKNRREIRLNYLEGEILFQGFLRADKETVLIGTVVTSGYFVRSYAGYRVRSEKVSIWMGTGVCNLTRKSRVKLS